MKTIAIIAGIFVALCLVTGFLIYPKPSPEVLFLKAEEGRQAEYRQIVHEGKMVQAHLKSFSRGWIADCTAHGKTIGATEVLLIDSGDGQPGCGEQPAPKAGAAPSVAPPVVKH